MNQYNTIQSSAYIPFDFITIIAILLVDIFKLGGPILKGLIANYIRCDY